MIFGKRIRLRAIERADLPRFVAWLNDPEVRRYLLQLTPLSIVEEEQWYESMLKRPMAEHPLVIEINAPEGWLPVGDIGLNSIDWVNRQAEVGIFIGEKRFWSQGYGTEAMRLMVKHGFNNLGLNRIFLRVYENNARGIHAYENAGFQHEGRLRQALYFEGKFIDELVMSVLRSEWQEDEG